MPRDYNEMFLFRIGDCATKHQQLVSLRVLFLCRLGKDTMVPQLRTALFPVGFIHERARSADLK